MSHNSFLGEKSKPENFQKEKERKLCTFLLTMKVTGRSSNPPSTRRSPFQEHVVAIATMGIMGCLLLAKPTVAVVPGAIKQPTRRYLSSATFVKTWELQGQPTTVSGMSDSQKISVDVASLAANIASQRAAYDGEAYLQFPLGNKLLDCVLHDSGVGHPDLMKKVRLLLKLLDIHLI